MSQAILVVNLVTLVTSMCLVAGAWMWAHNFRGFVEDVLIGEIRRYDDRTRKRIEKMAGTVEDVAGMSHESLPETINGLVPGQPYKVR